LGKYLANLFNPNTFYLNKVDNLLDFKSQFLKLVQEIQSTAKNSMKNNFYPSRITNSSCWFYSNNEYKFVYIGKVLCHSGHPCPLLPAAENFGNHHFSDPSIGIHTIKPVWIFSPSGNGRYTEDASKTELRMKPMRLVTDEAFGKIIKRINALIEVNGEANYTGFVSEINQRIEKYKYLIARHKGGNDATEEKNDQTS